MKRASMKNPLTAEDWTFGKIIYRFFISILFIVWTVLGGILLFDLLFALIGRGAPPMILDIYTATLMALYPILVLILCLTLPSSRRKSVRIVKSFFSYKELNKLLSSETFFQTGLKQVYESRLWLKINGMFIPKHFIVEILDRKKTSGKLQVLLIHGRKVLYRTNPAETDFTKEQFLALLNHMNDDSFRKLDKKDLVKDFARYCQSGESLERLTYNWSVFAEFRERQENHDTGLEVKKEFREISLEKPEEEFIDDPQDEKNEGSR